MRLLTSILGATALVCALAPAAQAQSPIGTPGSNTPAQAVTYGDMGTTPTFVDTSHGLPVVCLSGCSGGGGGGAASPGYATGSAPSYTEGSIVSAPSYDLSGNMRVVDAAVSAALAGIATNTAPPVQPRHGQGSATTTAAQLVAARTGRHMVTIENESTTPVRIGGSGVTTSTGFLLPGVAGASLTITYAGALYAVTTSGTAPLSFYETF